MKKIIGIILIVGALALGYMGYSQIDKNTASVKILDTKIGFANQSKKEQGYLMLGGAVLLFIGGIYTLNKK